MHVTVNISFPFAKSGSPFKTAAFFSPINDFTSSDESCHAPNTLNARSRIALSLLVASARRTGTGNPLALTLPFAIASSIARVQSPRPPKASSAANRTSITFDAAKPTNGSTNPSPPRSATARIAATAKATGVPSFNSGFTPSRTKSVFTIRSDCNTATRSASDFFSSTSDPIISRTATSSPHNTAKVCAPFRTSAFSDARHFAKLADTSFPGLITPPSCPFTNPSKACANKTSCPEIASQNPTASATFSADLVSHKRRVAL